MVQLLCHQHLHAIGLASISRCFTDQCGRESVIGTMPDGGFGVRCISHRHGYVPCLACDHPWLGLQSNTRMDSVDHVGGRGRTIRARVVACTTGLLGYHLLRHTDSNFYLSMSWQMASL